MCTLHAFEVWQGDLHAVDKIDAAWKALATNRITIYQGDRAEEIVGDPLKNGLRRELGHLNCQHLPISADFKREKGATKAVLRLAARHSSLLKSIASEGEWRAVALAFFFAELSVRHDDAGIILDDPVSSLDDERRKYIADRLIEESTKRQVIIFTHDLPFLADLHHGAKANDVAMSTCGMWRWETTLAEFDSEIPFKALSLKKRVGQLRDQPPGGTRISPPIRTRRGEGSLSFTATYGHRGSGRSKSGCSRASFNDCSAMS